MHAWRRGADHIVSLCAVLVAIAGDEAEEEEEPPELHPARERAPLPRSDSVTSEPGRSTLGKVYR